jgi:hypothetical protein
MQSGVNWVCGRCGGYPYPQHGQQQTPRQQQQVQKAPHLAHPVHASSNKKLVSLIVVFGVLFLVVALPIGMVVRGYAAAENGTWLAKHVVEDPKPVKSLLLDEATAACGSSKGTTSTNTASPTPYISESS